MSKTLRKTEISRRQTRKRKLTALRKKYKSAKSESEKAKIQDKTKKIAPWLTKKEFTS